MDTGLKREKGEREREKTLHEGITKNIEIDNKNFVTHVLLPCIKKKYIYIKKNNYVTT